ncbi:uncharacterized protein AAEQ78_015636 [Lycaon pictus]
MKRLSDMDQSSHHWLTGSQAFQHGLTLHHWLSWSLSLQMADHRLLSFHNNVSQPLMVVYYWNHAGGLLTLVMRTLSKIPRLLDSWKCKRRKKQEKNINCTSWC